MQLLRGRAGRGGSQRRLVQEPRVTSRYGRRPGPARLGDADEGFLQEQRDGRDLREARLLETSVGRRLVGSHGREDAVVRACRAALPGLRGDDAQAESISGEGRHPGRPSSRR